jgi:hypothetical protein
MPFVIDQPKGVEIPDGTYKATLEKVEVAEGTFNGVTGPIRKWYFLCEVGQELLPISATSSMGTGPKTKTHEWLTAILGEAPKSGDTIEDPIGKIVLLTVSHLDWQGNPSQFPKVKQLTQYVQPATAEGSTVPR